MPKCRLFLVVPSSLESDHARSCLAAALAAGDVAALKVTGEASVQQKLLDAIQATAQGAGVAVLTENDPDLALECKTDGVEIGPDPARLAGLRRRLGSAAIIGARCGTSRHAAMEMAENGADFVALDADGGGSDGIVAWWAPLFTVPCIAVAAPGNAAQAIADGADFIEVPATMWVSAEAARREVEMLMAAIREQVP